ncbi:uncharacterized protein PHA67_014767 [Liasis olivaceus]
MASGARAGWREHRNCCILQPLSAKSDKMLVVHHSASRQSFQYNYLALFIELEEVSRHALSFKRKKKLYCHLLIFILPDTPRTRLFDGQGICWHVSKKQNCHSYRDQQ